MENKGFNQAVYILWHPNFKKLNLQQVQEVFRNLIASGVTKEEIATILKDIEAANRLVKENEERKAYNDYLKQNVSKLELLPRVVFKRLVEVGEIKGRDLVYLCNSSPILKSYCLANKRDVNGQVTEWEEIYNIALRNATGDYFKNATNPSTLYTKLIGTYHVTYTSLVNGDLGQRIIQAHYDYIRKIVCRNQELHFLNYSGHLFTKFENIVDFTEVQENILALDVNGNLWYDGILGNKYTTNPIKLPPRFEVYRNGKFLEIEEKIKAIDADMLHFYFLTEKGNLWRKIISLKFRENEESQPIAVQEIENEIKYFKPRPEQANCYCAIKEDGTIINNVSDRRTTFRLPGHVNPIKVVNSTFSASTLEKDALSFLLVLDSNRDLWILRYNEPPKIVDFDVVDFDIQFRNSENYIGGTISTFIVKTDGLVYRRKFNEVDTSPVLIPLDDRVDKIMIAYDTIFFLRSVI